MPDSPSATPENLTDIVFRAESLELCKEYFAQMKGKKMKGATRRLVEDALKKAENTDSFSFLLLSFIKSAADLVEPNNYALYRQFSSLLDMVPVSRHLREYVDATIDPSPELISALSEGINGMATITGEPQQNMTAVEVARLLAQTPIQAE